MPLDKKDLEQIKNIFIDAFEPFTSAIQGDFNHVNERFDTIDTIDKSLYRITKDVDEIKLRLGGLERRVIAIEDILTRHGKILEKYKGAFAVYDREFRGIKKDLKIIKKKDQKDDRKIFKIEQRLGNLELKLA